MKYLNAIFIGIKEVWAHKLRSLLTMLGIIMGVASLVAMAAIVKGLENGMKETMVTMGGADKVLLRDQMVPPHQQHLAQQAPGRTIKDVIALKESAPLIRLVSPEMRLHGAALTRGGKMFSPSELVGVWPEVLDMNMHTLQHGRFFNAIDEENASPVCVIGTAVRDELFGSHDATGREIIPIGEIINIKGQPFTIVGMFTHYESEQDARARRLAKTQAESQQAGPARSRGWGRRGNWAFHRKNSTVYIPLNTMWIRFRSGERPSAPPDPRLTDIDLKIADVEQLEPALQQARNVLMLTHDGIEDFTFRTQENQLESINKQIRNARLSGGIIAGISLLVGGIGILNIMMASVNERIREIGICKAIGATGPVIFLQVLAEGIAISVAGAAVGLVASEGLVRVISMVSPTANAPVITPEPMMLAVAFSACVGIIAGLFPAARAAQLDPIQALRYE